MTKTKMSLGKDTEKIICDICFKELDYKPVRVVVQRYKTKPYKQYYQEYHIDICNECLESIKEVIKWK